MTPSSQAQKTETLKVFLSSSPLSEQTLHQILLMFPRNDLSDLAYPLHLQYNPHKKSETSLPGAIATSPLFPQVLPLSSPSCTFLPEMPT